MPLRAIVFDFDGVIANSEPLHLRAFQEVLADRGLALSGHDYYERYLGFDDVGVFRAIGSANGTSFTPAEIDALVASKAAKIEALEEGVSILFPGAADAIRRARAAVPLAIASGSLGTEIRRVLDRERLISFFAAIISAEDVKAGKPAAEPYLSAVNELADSMGTTLEPGECVAVEDSVWGLESAHAAGLRTVAVTHTYDAAVLRSADLVISSLRDFPLDRIARLCST